MNKESYSLKSITIGKLLPCSRKTGTRDLWASAWGAGEVRRVQKQPCALGNEETGEHSVSYCWWELRTKSWPKQRWATLRGTLWVENIFELALNRFTYMSEDIAACFATQQYIQGAKTGRRKRKQARPYARVGHTTDHQKKSYIKKYVRVINTPCATDGSMAQNSEIISIPSSWFLFCYSAVAVILPFWFTSVQLGFLYALRSHYTKKWWQSFSISVLFLPTPAGGRTFFASSAWQSYNPGLQDNLRRSENASWGAVTPETSGKLATIKHFSHTVHWDRGRVGEGGIKQPPCMLRRRCALNFLSVHEFSSWKNGAVMVYIFTIICRKSGRSCNRFRERKLLQLMSHVSFRVLLLCKKMN